MANYIKKLEASLKESGVKEAGLAAIIHDIRVYLSSDKFHWPNDSVNVNDILRIIEQGQIRADDLLNDQVRLNIENLGTAGF